MNWDYVDYRNGARGAVIVETLMVLPLLLAVLGGIVDFSRSLADRAAILEIARTVGRVAWPSWSIDESRIAAKATRTVTKCLDAAGYDPGVFRTQVRVHDLPLGGNRYTKRVTVTVTALASLRPYHFLPGQLAHSGRRVRFLSSRVRARRNT